VGAVEDRAGVGGGAVDGMEVFADVTRDGNEKLARFEGGGEAREEFGFEGAGEGTEFDAMTEFAVEEIAQTDAGAGVVERDFAAEFEARAENLELFGSGEVAEAEELAREEAGRLGRGASEGRAERSSRGNETLISWRGGEVSLVTSTATRIGDWEAFEDPADSEVVFAGEVDAGEELRARAVRKGRGGEGLRCGEFAGEAGFAGFDEIVREEDGGVVGKFAEIFFSPGFGIVEAGLEFGGIQGQAGGDGVVDGDFALQIHCGLRNTDCGIRIAESVRASSRRLLQRPITATLSRDVATRDGVLCQR
jgi:hypothetical protein